MTLLGMGNMGQALCSALTGAGVALTVWNRNAAKAAPFAQVATIAETVCEAFESAEVVVACLSDYDATLAILDQSAVRLALAGKTLVQLASGTPQQAQNLADWCAANGTDYLDGKIFTYPARIGAAESVIGYSGGTAELFARYAPTLRLLAGASRYLAPQPGAAAVMDTAWLSTLYGATLGILQGAAFCRAHDVDVSAMFPLMYSWLHEINCEAEYYHRLLVRDNFEGHQASIDVHLAAAQHLLETARAEPGLTEHFPAYLVQLLTSLSRRGYGGLEIAAAINEFRQ
ncbi:NAD(P)-binding domain-containing protein [Mycolicibacterium sp. CBMA 295]|uniref:NAD(P)-dependent oxidoreductase n=1 Tax=Mycolicibacterium sp. CBMA 295 TaxID=2606605 RepID=UPI002816218C|nr:NAD(P)-binding domain-containing protein [Mycolicibacterium sp. CBMA 295]